MSGGKSSARRKAIVNLLALEHALDGDTYADIAEAFGLSLDESKKAVRNGMQAAGIHVSLPEARARVDEMRLLIVEANTRVRAL